MTPQERELLAGFLQQLAQAKADPKDPAADSLIRDAISRQPDADYLLVQRALGLDLALKAAQGQIAKLQAEVDQARPAGAGSFLGNSNSWGKSASSANSTPRGPGMAPAAPTSAWGSGLMANLATTAAGVVAGSFLYQGIQNLMGHHNPVANNALSDNALSDNEIAGALDDDLANDSAGLDDGGSDLV
jgi:hypothetical protein